MSRVNLLLLFFLLESVSFAQYNGGLGSTLPSTCITGSQFIKSGASAGIYYCSATNTWTLSGGSGETVPAGSILLIATGTCPSGYVEETGLNGVTLVGTLAANGNVGNTGGNNNITPVGTNSVPTFTGNALSNHAHELPFHGGTTPRVTAGYGTGTTIAATRALTNTTVTSAAPVLLSQSVTAGTPSGTVSAPTFTGTQFDNRSAFKFVIFCRKS
jgi:hypothetical protein